MNTLLIGLLVVVLFVPMILIGVVVWLGLRVSRTNQPNNEQIANLAGKMDAIQAQVDSNLKSMATQVGVFGEVKETLGKVTAATNRVAELGEDITKLQNILQSGLKRGGFGEILLGNLLAQVLPAKHFRMQYVFRDNQRVDAAILLGERILPIDSKFPLQGFDGESASKSVFCRNVKDRIDETAKYIRPVEGTFEFAMMYIPAENIYYEIISNGDLFNYAMGKRVIPVSPNSFYAYLQVIVFGLHGMQIEENARLILERISSLKKDLTGFPARFASHPARKAQPVGPVWLLPKICQVWPRKTISKNMALFAKTTPIMQKTTPFLGLSIPPLIPPPSPPPPTPARNH
jgi:DNA recombination protein RmuC